MSFAHEPIDLTLVDLLALQSGLSETTQTILDLQQQLPGLRPSRRRGQGLEFEDLREYASGDDPRFIDWNVTARTNRLHTRLYRDEQEQTTTIVVDLRPAMYTGTEALKARRAVIAGAKLLWLAQKKGDRCACLVFDNAGLDASRPRRGITGVAAACQLMLERYKKQLSAHNSARQDKGRLVSASQQHTLTNTFEWLGRAGRHIGRCKFVSDADGIEQVNPDPLLNLSAQGQLSWVLVLDKTEIDGLPRGRFNYSSTSKRGQADNRLISRTKTVKKSYHSKTVYHSDPVSTQKHLQQSWTSRTQVLDKLNIPLIKLECLDDDRKIEFNLMS